MIAGIGIDLIEIERIEQSIRRFGNLFLEKLFTPFEIEFCGSKPIPAQHYAARFAAKEAIYKATPKEFQQYLTWQCIEIYTEKNGAPLVKLVGAGKTVEENGFSFMVSLTHTKVSAACSAICISS